MTRTSPRLRLNSLSVPLPFQNALGFALGRFCVRAPGSVAPMPLAGPSGHPRAIAGHSTIGDPLTTPFRSPSNPLIGSSYPGSHPGAGIAVCPGLSSSRANTVVLRASSVIYILYRTDPKTDPKRHGWPRTEVYPPGRCPRTNEPMRGLRGGCEGIVRASWDYLMLTSGAGCGRMGYRKVRKSRTMLILKLSPELVVMQSPCRPVCGWRMGAMRNERLWLHRNMAHDGGSTGLLILKG